VVKKLYVGGISYGTTQQGLSDAFAKAGTVVSATVITDKMTGRSKGFGFVEMASEEEASAAIAMYDGKELDGRTINVSEARPKEDRPARPPFRGGNGGRGGDRNDRGGDRRW
jgi:RNA recognition motif-containing protein